MAVRARTLAIAAVAVVLVGAGVYLLVPAEKAPPPAELWATWRTRFVRGLPLEVSCRITGDNGQGRAMIVSISCPSSDVLTLRQGFDGDLELKTVTRFEGKRGRTGQVGVEHVFDFAVAEGTVDILLHHLFDGGAWLMMYAVAISGFTLENPTLPKELTFTPTRVVRSSDGWTAEGEIRIALHPQNAKATVRLDPSGRPIERRIHAEMPGMPGEPKGELDVVEVWDDPSARSKETQRVR